MMHAPEMSPTLDGALRALDGASVNGVISAAQLATVRGFLEQLDDVRDVPGRALNPAEAAHLEGAYQAGVRCADESGHVLVVSLPAFLKLCPPARATPTPGLFARGLDWLVERPVLMLAAVLVFGALVALLVDQDVQAAGWLAFAGTVMAMSWCVAQLPPTRCTYVCNSGRACTCRPQPDMKESK